MGKQRRIQPGEKNVAILFDYQSYQDGNTQRCAICLEERQIDLLLTLMPYVGWPTRWRENNAGVSPTKDEMDALRADMELCLMCSNCGGIINCSCEAKDISASQLYLQRKLMDNAVPLSFAQDVPDTDFTHNTGDTSTQILRRQAALCSLIRDLIDTIRLRAYQNFQVAGFAATVLGTALTLINPIIGAIVSIAAAKITQETLDALSDADAIQAVACCMYDNLAAAAISQASFEASLNNCGFSFPSHEATVAGIIADNLYDEANWFAFVASIASRYTLATNSGQSNGYCGCGELCPYAVSWGTLVEEGADYIIVDAVFRNVGFGDQVGWNIDLDPCCFISSVQHIELPNGNISQYVTDCDNVQFQYVGGACCGHFSNYVQNTTTDVFRSRINFDTTQICP